MGGRRPVDVGALSSGAATTRLSDADADRLYRAQIASRAARYLLRSGNGDLLAVLGLDAQDSRVCKGCGELFVPRTARQWYHSKRCHLTKAVVE